MSQSTFVKSTIILTVATLLSKVLGSVFRIPLQNIAGDEVVGIFNLVYPVYMVALYLSVAGIPLAISKLIAEANARDESYKVKKIYMTSSFLAIAFGVLSFSVILGLSDVLATWLGGAKFALIVVACTLLVAPYMAVYRGFFQGHGNMQPTAVSQVLEQLTRAVLIIVIALVLVQFDFEAEVVAGGVMFGSILGALASLVYLRLKYARSDVKVVDKTPFSGADFKSYSKTILVMSIPIAIGSVTMALMNFVDSFTIAYALRDLGLSEREIRYEYGVYGRGLTLVQIVTVFASAIILPLVPLISQKLAVGDRAGASGAVSDAHKMTHLISWPAALGLFALTLPLNVGLFTNAEGSSMMAILNVSAALTALTILGTGALQGLNKARVGAYIVVGAVVVKVFTNIVLVKAFGLDGAAWSTLLVYALIFVTNSIVIYRAVPYKAVSGPIVKIVIASAVMAAVVGLPTLYLDVAEWSRLVALGYALIAMGVGAVVYFGLLFGLKAVTLDDLAGMPVIGGRVSRLRGGRGKVATGDADASGKADTKVTVSDASSTNSLHSNKSGSPTGGDGVNIEKKGKSMKKQKLIIWAMILVLLAVSSIGLIERWKVEQKSDTFELIVPYSEIVETVETSDKTVEEVLAEFKEAGLTTVSLSPFTLKTLNEDNEISLFEDFQLIGQLRFTEYRDDVDPDKKGYYITVPENEKILAILQNAFEMEELTIAGEVFYFIPQRENEYTSGTGIGYDPKLIEMINDVGLKVLLRIENHESEFVNNDLVDQMLDLNAEGISGILPEGVKPEWIGFNHPQMLDYMNAFYDNGVRYYYLESNKFVPKGQETVFRSADYDVIRLLSIDRGRTLSDSIEITIRGVKERNIKAVMYHIPEKGNADELIENTVTYLETVVAKSPGNYKIGEPKSFEDVDIPGWVTLAVGLAGVLFMFLMGEMWGNRLLQVAGALFMLALLGAYFVLNKLVFIQGFALIIACVTPIYAIVRASRGSTNIGKILVGYLKAAGITVAGIAIVVGLLNGNGFVSGVEHFRGVKLVYIVPIAGAMLYALLIISGLYEKGLKAALFNSVKLFNFEVRYWHIAVLVIVAAVGLFYISRTGNAGTASALELSFRTWLENTLYVRPRTKEFLIGFPIFVLALYVMGVNRKWGSLLLVPGVIGFLSIMNTFTHFHIPLYVSLLRTVYGLAIGFVIGLVLIGLFIVARKVAVRGWAMAKEKLAE